MQSPVPPMPPLIAFHNNNDNLFLTYLRMPNIIASAHCLGKTFGSNFKSLFAFTRIRQLRGERERERERERESVMKKALFFMRCSFFGELAPKTSSLEGWLPRGKLLYKLISYIQYMIAFFMSGEQSFLSTACSLLTAESFKFSYSSIQSFDSNL